MRETSEHSLVQCLQVFNGVASTSYFKEEKGEILGERGKRFTSQVLVGSHLLLLQITRNFWQELASSFYIFSLPLIKSA